MEDEKNLTKKERKALAREEKRKEKEAGERKGAFKKWGIWLLVIGALIWGVVKLANFINTPSETPAITLEVNDSDWVKGDSSASATLIEYGDFQCPACATYFPIIKELASMEGVRVVYRHFPLLQIHPNAMPAALAAEAAGLQGKFWEMHDILYERQDEWSKTGGAEEKFVSYAEELGLDVDRFKVDVASAELKEKVNEDIISGNKAALNSTPSFFLNGERIQNPTGLAAFKALIEAQSN